MALTILQSGEQSTAQRKQNKGLLILYQKKGKKHTPGAEVGQVNSFKETEKALILK